MVFWNTLLPHALSGTGFGSRDAACTDAVIDFHHRQQRRRRFHFEWRSVLSLYLFISGWLVLAYSLPGGLWHETTQSAMLLIGALGTWRYSWWMVNFIRSRLFYTHAYPVRRARADALWHEGWRPGHVHFLMTTFHEREATTEHFLDAIVRELRREDLKGTLWVGYGAPEDEHVIRHWMGRQRNLPLSIVLVHQNQPGKRVAIGLTLRALSRHGVGPNDVAYLMDGDSILGSGALQKTLSLFGADPELTALTTDEEAVVFGPRWVAEWLAMRFAQRRMWMSSHALSHRVLTLTGRMSAFRASAVVEREFIRTVEADELSHWLWGHFRFLSGDDKSTWYHLLRNRRKMTFVPDAMVYTIEYIEGNGLKRMRDNLLRWSGNMLRNGMRAIALGPRTVPPFIWWCLIDQRLSIWTVLTGFTTAVTISLFVTPWFFITYLLWIALTRFLMSIALWCYAGRIRISFPFLLYANQLLSAMLKVFILFHLPYQRWVNRQNQSEGETLLRHPFRRAMAAYINLLYLGAMCFIVLLVTGVLQWPEAYQL